MMQYTFLITHKQGVINNVWEQIRENHKLCPIKIWPHLSSSSSRQLLLDHWKFLEAPLGPPRATSEHFSAEDSTVSEPRGVASGDWEHSRHFIQHSCDGSQRLCAPAWEVRCSEASEGEQSEKCGFVPASVCVCVFDHTNTLDHVPDVIFSLLLSTLLKPGFYFNLLRL